MTAIGTYKNKLTPKNLIKLQMFKEFSDEADDDEDIVSDLTPQEDSGNSNNNRYHITTNSTIIPVLI